MNIKEYKRQYNKKWRQDNPDKVKEHNKKWNPINNPKRIFLRFMGKIILLEKNPRLGICQVCKKKKGEIFINSRGKTAVVKTHIHHTKYDKSDPLKHTIELCESCHNKESRKLGQLKKFQGKNKIKENKIK